MLLHAQQTDMVESTLEVKISERKLSGHAISSFYLGGNHICSLVWRLWEHFGGQVLKPFPYL